MNNEFEQDLQPIFPSPSFKGEVEVKPKSIIPSWKREKKRGKKKEKTTRNFSLSKPIIMSLLTVLVMVLSLLTPLTVALAKATSSLSGSTENLIRRLGNGNDSKGHTQGTPQDSEK